MKLTIDNYFDQVSGYLDIINSNANLVAGHDFMVKATKEGKNLSIYQKSASIKETLDLYLEKLNNLKAKQEQKPEKPPAKKPKTESSTKKTGAPKPAKQPDTATTEMVEHIASDIALVKRYISLHDKDKSYEQVLSVWRAFNKAIVERKVTKDSPYKAEIATMNASLKTALEQAKSAGSLHLVIAPGKLKTYKAIAESVEKSLGVSILLEFINISGKAGMKERATKLLRRIEKAQGTGKLESDRYAKEIRKAQSELEAYLNKEAEVVNVNDYTLSGIGSIAVLGCSCGKGLSGTGSEHAVIGKLKAEKVKNLQDAELERAFRYTVAPSLCKTIASKLIVEGKLTMSLLRNSTTPGEIKQLSSKAEKPYDLGLEITDMRLKTAAAKEKSIPPGKGKANGLSGVEAPSYDVPEEVKIMSALELVNQKFRTMGLEGKYRKLIGDPEPGFSAMIYGKPKQGKSTVAIDLAKELTHHGRVLYCAFEEGHGYTLQDKVKRNNADVPGLDFANRLPANLSMYQFVFVDSVSDAGLDEIAFKNLIKTNKPNTSILGVFHATKDGKFRGGQTYAHDVDVLIRVEDGVAYAQGRFAPPGQMSITSIHSDANPAV